MNRESWWADRIAWVSLLVFTVLWVARWPILPPGLDSSYHLCIAQPVREAGGPMVYEWWEYAPAGRPHLYPPLVHLLIALLLKAGCPPLMAIRLLSALIVPMVVWTLYVVTRRLWTPVVALSCLLLAAIPFSFHLKLAETLASGLALCELLWFMVAIRGRRTIAAACLLGLMWYTHLGIPWVAVMSMGWAWLMKAIPRDRRLWISLAAGVLLGSPWLWHLGMHLDAIHVIRRYENELLDVIPLLYLFALAGAWRAWRQGGGVRLLVSLWLGFCVMAFPFTFRWLSGEGLLPLILLAGFGVAICAETLARRQARGHHRVGWIVLLAGLVLLCPSWRVGRGKSRVSWRDTAPFHLLNWSAAQPRPTDVQLHDPSVARWAGTVARISRPREILWSNASYTGGLVAALAGRPTSSAMFYEVPPRQPFDPLTSAHWVLWFKIAPEPGQLTLDHVVHQHPLTVIEEDDIATLFQNASATELARRPQPVLPWWLASGFIACLMGMAVWDVRGASIRLQ